MLIICTKYILRLIRWEWLLRFYYIFVNKEKLHHFRLTQFSVGRWSKCNIFSLDLLKTYAIFLHYDRHFSWQYFTFERDTQFWYTDWGRQLYNVYMVWMSDIIFTQSYASFQTISDALFFIMSVSLIPFSFHQPPISNWHKIS